MENTVKPLDAKASVSTSSDGLKAEILLEPPANGGKEADYLMLFTALKNARVSFGIDNSKLQELSQHPVYGTPIVIAEGKPAVNGKDGKVEYHVQTNSKASPKVRPDGSVDYKDLNILQNVKKGQLLCTITPPTNGTEGKAVTGRRLLPAAGRNLPHVAGRNTVLNENQTVLTAAIDGQVKIADSRVNVFENLDIGGDVDTSTGNIKFVGNIQIHGSIQEGFSVEADGNITVDGVVYGGSIKSGGSLIVNGGIVGGGVSSIECKGDLTCTYLENCEVKAAGCINAGSIMNCSVSCAKSIDLSGPQGKLMGGHCVVGENVSAKIIGSPSGLRTELVLGCDPEMFSYKSKLEKEIAAGEADIEKLNQIVSLLNRYKTAGALPPAKQKMLENSTLSLNNLSAMLEKQKNDLNALEERINSSKNGYIVCKGKMYSGTVFSIGSAMKTIYEDFSPSKFFNVDGEIAIVPLE